MKAEGRAICRVNNFALHMEDHGQGPVFMAYIVEDNGDIIASTQIDITLLVFLEKCIGIAVDELLGNAVRENWYAKTDGEDIPQQA